MSATDSDSYLPEQPFTESIDSEVDLPEYPFTESQRRYLRIVNETTPLSDIIRAQAVRPQRPPKRHYLSRLTSISESISESQYSGVTEYYEEARVARSQSISLPDPIQDYFVPTTDPPSLSGDKVKTRNKIYRGLARLFSQSSTSLAELSSATKEKIKDFKLARSKSTFNLPGLVSPSPSASSSSTIIFPPHPAVPTRLNNRSTLPTAYSESAFSISSFEPLPTEPPSKWTKTRRGLRAVPQGQEELGGNHQQRPRISSGHWSSPHRPSRSTTDANGSPAASRLYAMRLSKASSSPRSPCIFDPITPPPPSLQTPHIFKPIISPSTPTGVSHLFTPVTSAASPTSKSAHNFKPVIVNKSQSPKSQHNFEPVILNKSQTPKSSHNLKPIIVDDLATPISPHTFTPLKSAPSPSFRSFPKFESDVCAGLNIHTGSSFCPSASTPSLCEFSHAAPQPFSPEAERFTPRRPPPFKTRYKPYTPRPYTEDKGVTFPNGLDGDNPYPRPYGGGWRNHPYHLYERLTTAQLLVDPYAKPPKPPKKKSSHNHYGGRSAAQRESTRYVHRASNGELHEAFEMVDLSTPKDEPPNVTLETDPDELLKPFVGTAATILQRVRGNLKLQHVKGYDPAGNIYFYEKSYVPRFTKHSLRPSKRPFSIRNLLNRRLYGRPGDGSNLLMPHIPFEVKIPGVDVPKEVKPDIEERAEAHTNEGTEINIRDMTEANIKKRPLSPYRNFLDDEWKAELKKAQTARQALQKKKARELKKKRKEEKKARGPFYSFKQHREERRLARAKKNYEKELEEEAKKEKTKASEPSILPHDLQSMNEPVDCQDFAFTQDAYEKQRAIALKEARSGKKNSSFPDPVSDSLPRPDGLHRNLFHDYDHADIDLRATALSTNACVSALVPRTKVSSASVNSRISRRDKANRTLMANADNKKREDDQHLAKGVSFKPDELGVWRTSKVEAKEADYAKHQELRQRKPRAEKMLAEQLQKKQESTPEKPLQPMANTPKSIATEFLGVSVSPPRIRTPDRYKSYTFEEAEQLVTPKSPQQCQYEADQAATPHSSTPFHLPSVEEEFDVEYEKQIADLSDTFREFL
ncbi:hypothetical protein QM012_004676 [Aureobasidium pullulans]|uniref:Uncharacterized protein n=1 Tax=Aureobasidium pullulans TaxID=5580 RepID=A0ABR0TTX6_AURPU